MRLFSRRALLWGSLGTLGGIAALGAGSLWACNRGLLAAGPGLAPAEAARRLAEALPEVFEPARLAAHWHEGGSPAALTRALEARPRVRDALAADCPAIRRTLLREAIAADFAAGDIVIADRLVVSRTECLVAALCAGPAARA
jgi:hypothetical protein